MKKELKKGDKLTIFGISSFMANTTKSEIVIKDDFNGQKSFSEKGKRKLYYFRPTEENMIFEGHDLPIITDGEVKRISSNGFTCSSFSGNACYNIASRNDEMTMAEVKAYIIKNQLNENFTDEHKAKILFVSQNNSDGIRMFPELYKGGHAVIDRIAEKEMA